MNKYIIEIEDVPFSKVRIDADGAQNINLYRAKGFSAIVFDEHGLDKLTPFDKALSSELGEAYHKGFEVGQHEATTLEYQQGLEEGKKQARAQAHLDVCHDIERVAHGNYQKGLDDAWGTIIKIALIPYAERSEIFDGQQDILSIMQKFSPSEVITKIKAYEEQKKADEIKVGDEVCFVFAGGETIEPFIVFSIKDDNGKKYYEGIQTSDGRWVSGGLKYYKTGRNFPQVAELVKAMKGGAE